MEYKTKTIITKIEHGELVDMLSTMLYGNGNVTVGYDEPMKKLIKDSDVCLEEKLASILLGGGEIFFGDTLSEKDEEPNGKLRYFREDGMIKYRVTITDIKDGLAKCMDSDNKFLNNAAYSFIRDDGEADAFDGDCVLQIIIFGEIVYG